MKNGSLNTLRERTVRWVALAVGLLSLLRSGPAAEVAAPAAPGREKAPELEKKTESSPADYRNWFNVSVGGVRLNGDKAQFQRRTGLPGTAFGGVEAFHYEQDVGKKGLFKIEGRGIFDNHDYSIKMELSDPDKGYFRAGYQEARTWYDGSGGFYPPTGRWISVFDEALALERGEAFVEAGLTLPDRPQVTFEYQHLFRDGQKESLVWGDSTQTGLPASTSLRGIVPSFWDINETRDIIAGDVSHTLGNTDVGVGLRYEVMDNNNSRNIRRQPGEGPADRHVTQREGVESDMFNAHAFTETRFNDKVMLTTGYSFTTLDSDLSGSRIYGPGYDPIYDAGFGRTADRNSGYYGLAGGSQMKQYVLNLNLMFTPWESFYIVPSVRVEKQDLDSFSEYSETSVPSTTQPPRLGAQSDRDIVDVSEGLEARYTGLTNWVLYARANWLQGEGDQRERALALTTGNTSLFRDTDFDRFTQKYTAGANWYPLSRLHFAAQYYRKIREDDFDHRFDTTVNTGGNRYPAFLTANNFDTDDVNFRVTWRPFSQLTSVSRYDFQRSTIEMDGDGIAKVESADIVSHIVSQSLTWTPLARLYAQASINYVWDQTDTPADGQSPVVADSDNKYWNASFMTGYALTEKTDLQAQYFYYRADNFVNNAAATQPFGADAEEHGVTATVIHRLKQNLQWTLKYGFFNNRDRTSGGHNDYDAHLVYSSVRCWF